MKKMTVSIYTRDEQGLVTYKGSQDWSSEGHFLLHYELADVEPEEERPLGWPHTRVRWYRNPDAPTSAAIGIGG